MKKTLGRTEKRKIQDTAKAARWKKNNPTQVRSMKVRRNAASGTVGRRKRWTTFEDELIFDGEMTDFEMAEKLGRTISSIQSRRHTVNRTASFNTATSRASRPNTAPRYGKRKATLAMKKRGTK